MTNLNPSEKYQSQIPALQLLVNLGFEPLSQQQVESLRGKKLHQVLLEDILEERLLKLNQFTVKGQGYPFDIEDAQEAIRQLKPSPDKIKGLMGTNQCVGDMWVFGATIRKTIDGDSKSHSMKYIDWELGDNRYHVAAEFAVSRTGSTKTCRCDIVCFVNGIPFIIIENKSPTVSLKKAQSQLISYQSEDNIPHLFHYAQILLTMNRAEAKYATVGSSAKYWLTWREKDDRDEDIAELINQPLNDQQKYAIFSGDFREALPYFDDMLKAGNRIVTEQDRLLHALCRPERLLDLIRRFTVFDLGVRKIARHQQYFGILATLNQVKDFDVEGRRKGGVIWHTQGSGKSLTMVMLARALALSIPTRRIIIVTDRDDLDKQIKETFKSCEMSPVRASSGANLLNLIENRTPLITTIINKFENAFRLHTAPQDDPNLFVLVDESHRTQNGKYNGLGNFAKKMRRLLGRACYIGFTGTPLLRKEKNTLEMFGGLIHQYTIAEAVPDGAVVPLFYEGRLVEQKIAGPAIDQWFNKISVGLSDSQKADLKKKFSRLSKITTSLQPLMAKTFDISEHYREFWQHTGFKAQLVAPSKAAAIMMKEWLDEIGHVSSEVIISPPDEHEGKEDIDSESKSKVRQFWEKMMKRYHDEDEYNRQIIDRFKSSSDPEILIVVSKLLTGFDAPRNTVLYLCRSLKEHNLLQAIARVNRLFEENGKEKEFGLIVDYEGLLGELDEALTTYSSFEGYDELDLKNAIMDVREEIRKLPDLYERLWDLFKTVPNKKDMERMEQYLADIAIREVFYEYLKAFGRGLHIALASEKVHDVIEDKTLEQYRRDLKYLSDIKRRVQIRYQEVVDIKDYEPKIQKLLDNHIIAEPARTIIDMVNINDPDSLGKVMEEQGISEASKADRIASATKRTITENMELDPALYKRFSELLEEVIANYRAHRLSETAYLKKVTDIAKKVARREHNGNIPKTIASNDDAMAFYGMLEPMLKSLKAAIPNTDIADIALSLIDIFKKHHVVNVWANTLVQNKIHNAIDDYFFDVVKTKYGLEIPVTILDELEQQIMRLARARFPG